MSGKPDTQTPGKVQMNHVDSSGQQFLEMDVDFVLEGRGPRRVRVRIMQNDLYKFLQGLKTSAMVKIMTAAQPKQKELFNDPK